MYENREEQKKTNIDIDYIENREIGSDLNNNMCWNRYSIKGSANILT